jgi:hypothetical protein
MAGVRGVFNMKAFQSRPVRKLAAVVALALGACAAGTSVASAGTSAVNFTSNTNVRGLGSFSGTATLDNTTDLLTVVMNNTSSKGYLYGFAFDLDVNEKAKVMNEGKHGFKSVGRYDVKAAPYGKYEAGAMDSGSNRHAIAAEASKTFVFRISGMPSGMTAFDLLDNPKGESMVAMFRGFHNGKKDRAGAAVVIPVTPSIVDGSTGNNAPSPTTGGTIVTTTTTGTTSTGGKPTGGTINPPGNGGGTTTAIPLPSAALSGMTLLALGAGVMATRKIGSMSA